MECHACHENGQDEGKVVEHSYKEEIEIVWIRAIYAFLNDHTLRYKIQLPAQKFNSSSLPYGPFK